MRKLALAAQLEHAHHPQVVVGRDHDRVARAVASAAEALLRELHLRGDIVGPGRHFRAAPVDPHVGALAQPGQTGNREQRVALLVGIDRSHEDHDQQPTVVADLESRADGRVSSLPILAGAPPRAEARAK